MMGNMTAGENPMKSCPMSAFLGKISGMRGFGFLALIPGLLFVFVGVAIILEPQILIWLMAAAAIFAGLMLVAAATFFRKVTAGLQS
jgi:Na+-transporting NADH:ubiquinone oxidoreductase subunit NqrD